VPFIPHTPDDISQMLAAIGITDIEQLFDEVPAELPLAKIHSVPPGLNEAEVTRLMKDREPSARSLCFIGAGAYDHHIPAAIWQIATRGEFYTAYTPYQAEASQGSLQLIYEYQTMMSELMAMDVSNASLYDGATALAEAVLMAVRIKRGKAKRIILPDTINPVYRDVLISIVQHQGIIIERCIFDEKQGIIDPETFNKFEWSEVAALVIPQPNFFGCLEEIDALTRVSHAHDALVIACVNPTAMALLKPPGQWGDQGADIVCGEGQSLGVPLASGGPYFGFMCCKLEWVRQMPGRIVGRTVDAQGREGFTLTLQAREQHIRRSKATSNICTNQGLIVVAATIYLSLLGAEGLREVALLSHTCAVELKNRLSKIPGVKVVFNQPCFHEFVIQFDKPVKAIIAQMARDGIQAGFDLSTDFPALKNALLVCATETKSLEDLSRYEESLAACLTSFVPLPINE
jgi:glycine dehydrogenase subunit 1